MLLRQSGRCGSIVRMKNWGWFPALAGTVALAFVVLGQGSGEGALDERLVRARTLGKAFYENPTTQAEAAEQLRAAWALRPESLPDRLNYGLALLRAGRTEEGMRELEAVQKADPSLPHTWFNLGIELKKLGETERAIAQLERMAQLDPAEPITQYNLGVLYKLADRGDEALKKFELAARLDPYFAAPHFQLFNAYRQSGKAEGAKREFARFQDLRKRQEAAGAGNEDVEWSMYSELVEAIESGRSKDAGVAAAPRFAAAEPAAGETDPASAQLEVMDVDGDGLADLVVASSRGVAVYLKGMTPSRQPALEGLEYVVSVAAGDFDNDGWADLCVVTHKGPLLFRNERGTFRRHGAKMPDAGFNAAVWVDFDHDYDLDLLLLGQKSVLLRNQGQAGFADRSGDFPFGPGEAVSGVVTRVTPDTKAHDVIVSYKDRAGVWYRDRLGAQYEAVTIEALPAGAAQLKAADVNNDGRPDLLWAEGAALNEAAGFRQTGWPGRPGALGDFANRGLLDVVTARGVARGLGEGRWGGAVQVDGLLPGTVYAAADFDGDGRVDVAWVTEQGRVQRALNQTEGMGNWLNVQLAGIKNLKLAPGAEVEVKAGLLYQKQTYRGVPLLFGMRGEPLAETVRITWPNGLIQNEMRQKAGAAYRYEEAQRLSGSCPLIWTWNGREFEYITDVLGVAPLGAAAGDGTYFPVDHDEYIWIDGSRLKPRGGGYEVRVTEELSEVSYVDEVELIAVDHPAGMEVFTNDKWKAPPFPEFRLFGAREKVYPRQALEDGRRDVTDRVRRRDRRYPDGFEHNLQGVAAMHTLELDFRGAAQANRAVLILHGWVDWADGSTFLAQAQETRAGLVPPYLQAKDERGEWVTVIEDMGMPAGKPKTIAVDLTGKFIGERRELRIVTNLCVFWDEIFLSEDAGEPEARLTALKPARAGLRFRGFARTLIHPQRKQPEMFFYGQPLMASLWNPTPGMYTRYGPVAELLRASDNKLVVFGSGDELRLEYEAGTLPPLPTGWKRDFLLKVVGWAKDRDANTAFSQTVEPLPFHGMESYPYPAHQRYPESEELREYRAKWNTRRALRLLRPLASDGTQRGGGR